MLDKKRLDKKTADDAKKKKWKKTCQNMKKILKKLKN